MGIATEVEPRAEEEVGKGNRSELSLLRQSRYGMSSLRHRTPSWTLRWKERPHAAGKGFREVEVEEVKVGEGGRIVFALNVGHCHRHHQICINTLSVDEPVVNINSHKHTRQSPKPAIMKKEKKNTHNIRTGHSHCHSHSAWIPILVS